MLGGPGVDDEEQGERVGGHAPEPSLVAPLLVAVTCGLGVSANARLNGELAVRSHSALFAATLNFATGLVLIAIAIVIMDRRSSRARGPRSRGLRSRTKWWFWIGGLSAAVGQWGLSAGTPRVGVSLITLCFAAGLSSGGLIADRLGLGTSGTHFITPQRVAGAALAILAVGVAVSGGLHGTGQVPYLLWVFGGGFLVAGQQPVNGRLALALGDPLRAMFVSFGAGLIALSIVLAFDWPSLAWPGELWVYTGGLIAAVSSVTTVFVVGRLGALRLSVALVGGQLTGAAVLEAIVPVPGTHLTVEKVIGAVIALAAVALVAGASWPGAVRSTRRPSVQQRGSDEIEVV